MSVQPFTPIPTDFPFLPHRRWSRRSFRLTALLYLGGGVLVGGGLIGAGMARFPYLISDPLTVPSILLGAFIAGWVLMSASATFVTASRYDLTDSGLRVRLFGWLALTIPWDNVRQGHVTAYRAPLPYRRLEDHERLVVLQVAGLTPLHRLASLYYGFGSQPALLITPDHAHYRDLIRLIADVKGIEFAIPQPPPASTPDAVSD